MVESPLDPRTFAARLSEAHGLEFRYRLELTPLQSVGMPVVELSPDAAFVEYAREAARARHGRFKTWLHRSLRGFLSDFDINGLLGTYPMHVLSSEQFAELLQAAPLGEPTTRLLDIGAGRGDVTSQLAVHFSDVTVTETSGLMARRLRKSGYRVLEGDFATLPDGAERYDVVSLLNVLDRCDQPLRLLGAARAALKPGGRLLIALVLPYRPFVYDHAESRAPRERLPITDDHFEHAALEFIDYALQPLGLHIESLSRAPYLSGGDAQAPLYVLDDLLIVARAEHELLVLGERR